MPLLWRYLLKNYFQVFFLIVIVFVSILLIMRTQEIARFASLGSDFKAIIYYALFQIPYILPIAIPVSALTSSFLLMQRLSYSNELTAIRAMGIPFSEIKKPLYISGLLLSLFNIYITAEITPYCRMLTKDLAYSSTTVNPLLLIQKRKLLKLKDSYIDLTMFNVRQEARDILFVTNNESEDRLTLITADKLAVEGEHLKGNNISIISSMGSNENVDTFDHLILENNDEIFLQKQAFSHLIKSRPWALNHEYLSLKFLLLKLKNEDFSHITAKYRTESEIIRRLFLSFAPFTFTIMGMCFGISLGKNKRKKGLIWVIALSTFTFTFFLIGKSFQNFPVKAFWFFFLPHPICILLSNYREKRIAKGFEI